MPPLPLVQKYSERLGYVHRDWLSIDVSAFFNAFLKYVGSSVFGSDFYYYFIDTIQKSVSEDWFYYLDNLDPIQLKLP